jgi:hypothetical protein
MALVKDALLFVGLLPLIALDSGHPRPTRATDFSRIRRSATGRHAVFCLGRDLRVRFTNPMTLRLTTLILAFALMLGGAATTTLAAINTARALECCSKDCPQTPSRSPNQCCSVRASTQDGEVARERLPCLVELANEAGTAADCDCETV